MYEKYLEFAKSVALGAGEITMKYFSASADNGADYKADNTIVTIADKEINAYLVSRVKEAFPDHAVDGEEEGFGKSRMTWVCDPIDGTAMYARRIPVSVFSLALVEDGESVVGVIYDAFGGNMYTALKGGGAYRNGVKISVQDSGFANMKTIANLDCWPDAEYALAPAYADIMKKMYTVNLGSVIRAASYVADGNFALAVYPGTLHKNCDIAAAKVIVEEAGGKVTDLFGNEQRYDTDINGAVISNGIIHKEVLDIIAKHVKNLK